MPAFSKISKFLDFQKVELCGTNGVFLVFSEIFLVINKGFMGPDLVNILEVPKIVQQVLQHVRKPESAIWE